MPLAFLTFQLLAPNGYQRRQTVKAQKGHDTAAFPRCGAFAIPTNAPRRWRCATRFETHCATTKCSPYPTDGQVGRGGFPTVVAVPLRRPREPRASGYLFLAARIRRELRPELFCGKRWLLAIVEPIGKQHERLTSAITAPRCRRGVPGAPRPRRAARTTRSSLSGDGGLRIGVRGLAGVERRRDCAVGQPTVRADTVVDSIPAMT
jgi:hypothetical protein